MSGIKFTTVESTLYLPEMTLVDPQKESRNKSPCALIFPGGGYRKVSKQYLARVFNSTA